MTPTRESASMSDEDLREMARLAFETAQLAQSYVPIYHAMRMMIDSVLMDEEEKR